MIKDYLMKIKRKILERINRLAIHHVLDLMTDHTGNFERASWLGKQIWQFPIGAWILQEMISQIKPDVIIETGTYRGGSAYFMASLCDLLNHGKIISIDPAPLETIEHPRVIYLKKSSIEPEALSEVEKILAAEKANRVLVVLDSNHEAPHVAKELEAYSRLIQIGGYIHLQDGIIDEAKRFSVVRPGPKVAAEKFLKNHPEFKRDKKIEERYLLNIHPCGWLKKVK